MQKNQKIRTKMCNVCGKYPKTAMNEFKHKGVVLCKDCVNNLIIEVDTDNSFILDKKALQTGSYTPSGYDQTFSSHKLCIISGDPE